MSTVWIVNRAGHNYHLSARWGTPRALTDGYVSLGSLDRILFTLAEGIKQSEPGDWLLLSGLMMLNASAAALWVKKHGQINLLIWDQKANNRAGGYRELRLASDHMNELLDPSVFSEAI